MRRSLIFASGAAALMIAVAPAIVAGADTEGAIHATAVSGPAQIFGFDSSGGCDPANLNPATGRCSLVFFQNDFLSGDLQGQERNAGSVSELFTNLSGDAVSNATYTGTVRGCPGNGTVLFRDVAKLGVDAPGHNTATVHVIPGSGTGGLATLKGSGHVDAHVGANGGTSTLVADFSCSED
jgi:hypothetical protein